MIMTQEEILKKLPKNCASRILAVSKCIENDAKKGATIMVYENRQFLRGYVNGIKDMGLIGEWDARRLIAFYGKDRFEL